MELPRQNHQEQAVDTNNKNIRVYRYLRYALYLFFIFASTQSQAVSAIPVKIVINVMLILIAEKMVRKKYYALFLLMMIDRTLVSSIELTDFFYSVFDPNTTYFFMLKIYDLVRVYYLVAVHVSFIYFITYHKEPSVLVVIMSVMGLFYFLNSYPDVNNLMFYFLYGFGCVASIYAAILIYNNFRAFDYKVLSLICVYFIYSALLIVKHVNQIGLYYMDFNMSYAYPLVLLLSLILLYGNNRIIQSMVHKYFVMFLIIVSVGLAFLQIENNAVIMQHIVFVTLILFLIKIVHDLRKIVLNKILSKVDE